MKMKEDSNMSSERNSERSEDRVERVPFGGFRLKMQLSDADMKGFKARGMVTHWFNDVEGRIARAQGAGYDFVDPKHVRSLGQGALHKGSTDESAARVSIVVSKGHPVITAFLMEIKEEFYKEDQATKELGNAQVDNALALGGKGRSEFENDYKPN